jgi:hypothetical protein
MNPKRLAGVINILAAAVFISLGVSRTPMSKFEISIGVLFLVVGIVRLRKTPPGPPAP